MVFACVILSCIICIQGAEIQLSMALVCVPLDIQDTLYCYHQALERRSHCSQLFQHSRSLLLLLLAYTQPCELKPTEWKHTNMQLNNNSTK